MAERAVAFSHLREQDETLSAGPISREVPLRECAGFDPDADTVRRLAANGTGLPGDPGEGLAASLSAATDELREYPSAIDPVAGRTLLAGAVSAAADAERRRQYVAAVFDVLGSLAAYRDTYVAARRVLDGEGGATELKAMIARGETDCGPTDGPEEEDIFPEREFPRFDWPIDVPGWDDEDDIVNEHWWGFCITLRDIGLVQAKPYTITHLDPSGPCAGETLTIHGRDFGQTPGRVVFRTQGGKVAVAPDSWSDTKITVTVPSNAVAGSLSLSITRGTVEVCDRHLVKRAPASDSSITTWSGGKPNVSVYVSDSFTRECFAPGETVEIGWSYAPQSLSNVTLSLDRVGSKTVSNPSGTWRVTVPNGISRPTDLTAEIEASNECGQSAETETVRVNVRPSLSIEDIEVTQGIQTFTVGPAGPDNGLATIEDKDTIVRVYVSADRNGFNSDRVPDVTGSLSVGGRTLAPINGASPGSGPVADPSITAVANPTRAETDHSLNFRIPAALASGQQTFDIYVQGPEICEERATATRQMTWSWDGGNALPVRYVRVRHTRGNTTQPTRDEAQFTVQRAFDLFPSPPTDIGPAPDDTMTSSHNLGTNAGVQGLLGDLEGHRMRAVFAEWARRRQSIFDIDLLRDLLSHHYVALTEPFNRGWANNPGKTAVSCTWDNSDGTDGWRRIKTAHELGHTLDFDHVRQGCRGSPPNCGGSCYNHPNGGRLTEVPFDPYWNSTLPDDPDRSDPEFDFMSYGCTRWASSDSWGRLQNSI
jgi:hypothetical protein